MISVAALEEAVLALLCHSNDNASTLAMKLNAELFTSRINQLIARTALDYISKYKSAPAGNLEYLLETELRRGEEGKLLSRVLDNFKKASSGIHAPYVLEQLDNFIEIQRLSSNLQQAMEHLHTGDLAEAQKLVFKVSTPHVNGNAGIWLSDPSAMLKGSDTSTSEFFSCGVPILDSIGCQLDRKTLSFIIASTGKGKSWWLIELGKTYIQHHHKVLHITLELSQEKTAFRYLQAIFALTKKESREVKLPFFERDSSGIASIHFNSAIRDPVLSKKKEIKARLSKFPEGQLLIKEFPTSSLSTEQLNMYLDSLERDRHFRPDVLLIDYADLMKLDTDSLRIDTGRLYRDLRGIAMQRDLVLATASQGNRESEFADTVGKAHAAEDWSKPGTADNVFTYSQTSEEFKLGLARILAAKIRDDASGGMALICQSYAIGQFCLDSTLMSREVREEVGKLTKHETVS